MKQLLWQLALMFKIMLRKILTQKFVGLRKSEMSMNDFALEDWEEDVVRVTSPQPFCSGKKRAKWCKIGSRAI